MTLYADFTQIGSNKYYHRDLEARAALNGLGALSAKDKAALGTDVSGILPITNGGTGANSAASARNALELKKTGGQLTFYVAVSGNDTTGDGSENKPFRTIQHAVDICPYVSYCHIYVAPGTYDESVTVAYKFITFHQDSSGGVIIRGTGTNAALRAHYSIVEINFINATFISNSPTGTISSSNMSLIKLYNISNNSSDTILLQNTNSNGVALFSSYGGIVSDDAAGNFFIHIASSGHGVLTNSTGFVYMHKFIGNVNGMLYYGRGGMLQISQESIDNMTFNTEKVLADGAQYLKS